jgi:hypothetical protein
MYNNFGVMSIAFTELKKAGIDTSSRPFLRLWYARQASNPPKADFGRRLSLRPTGTKACPPSFITFLNYYDKLNSKGIILHASADFFQF